MIGLNVSYHLAVSTYVLTTRSLSLTLIRNCSPHTQPLIETRNSLSPSAVLACVSHAYLFLRTQADANSPHLPLPPVFSHPCFAPSPRGNRVTSRRHLTSAPGETCLLLPRSLALSLTYTTKLEFCPGQPLAYWTRLVQCEDQARAEYC